MKWSMRSTINQSLFWVLVFASCLGYYWLCYETERANFLLVFGLFFGLFICYILFVQFWDENVKLIVGLGVLFRLIVLFSFPNLSDDIYRFIWDGHLLANGENPFLYTPNDYLAKVNQNTNANQGLLAQLNSPDYFTIYPPVLQYIFAFSSLLFPKNIFAATMVMKAFIFLAEIGTITVLIKLFKLFEIHFKNIAWYALNPLVVVELCGNVHFEALMIFFVLLAVWLMVKKRHALSAGAMGLAICSKLLPLMFLPFLIKRLGLRESVKYFMIVGVLCAILFAPFLSNELFQNLFSSIDLYFQKFEFNASVYYIVRWFGFQIKGWNIIQTAGPVLSILTTLTILMIALKERTATFRSLLQRMSVSLLIYFGLATIIHPWYATTLVAFTAFWKWRFPIVWSALIPLSYFAYSNLEYQENMWLIAVEYTAIPLFAFYEWRRGWNEEY